MALSDPRDQAGAHLSRRDTRTSPPGAAPLESADPRSIGPYRLIGRLGHGGMATVYLGEHHGLAAIKLIHSHLAMDLEFLARFAREVELAKRVPDFCTAAVRESGVHCSRPYLVTEYLDGDALHHLVGLNGPLNPAALHNLAIGLAAGLTAIHGCDLVHRDLKPSNVMVTRSGIRIIDFGIARAIDLSTNYTRTGMVMGSLGWAAPEQLDGAEPSPAMDVFGWGCLVAYAATGQHPFGGTDATNRSWRILHAEPSLAGLSPALRPLVGVALNRRADRRPTAQDLLLALVTGRSAPAGAVLASAAVRSPGMPAASKTSKSAAAKSDAKPAPAAAGRVVAKKPTGRTSAAGFPITGMAVAGSSPPPEANSRPAGDEPARFRWSRAGKVGLVLAALPLGLALVIAVASGAGDPFWIGGTGAGAVGRTSPPPTAAPSADSSRHKPVGGQGAGPAGEPSGDLANGSPTGGSFGAVGAQPTAPKDEDNTDNDRSCANDDRKKSDERGEKGKDENNHDCTGSKKP